MKKGRCRTCLWWWDLNGDGERRCYRFESPQYHRKTRSGCEKHEDSIDWRNERRRKSNDENHAD